VIQPHLPVRLPCYDFTPVTNPTLGILLQKVRVTTSGITSFHGVTGGVYKARERIHRCIADQRLLAIPPSCRRVAACNPNLERVYRLANLHRVASHCLAPLHRIKPHAPPLVRAPVNSFEFHSCEHTSQAGYLTR